MESEELTGENPNQDDKQEHLSRRRWLTSLVIGAGLGIAIAAGTLRLFNQAAKSPQTGQQSSGVGQTVTVFSVENTPVIRTVNVTGTVMARDLIPVLSEATGLQIQQILVKEGDVVQAGQVMAVLNESVLQSQLSQAKAAVESAQAVVGQRQAALAQVEATFAQAQRDFQRYQKLRNQGAISSQDLEVRETTLATDRQAVYVAQANVHSAQADVRNNMAKVQQLQTQLGQTLVRAPASGIVAEKIARVGDLTGGAMQNATATTGNQKLFSIIRNGLLEVDADVPATQLPQVQVSSPALITSDADKRVHLQGKVREIEPLVNSQTRQATVKIDLAPTSLLRPGLFVRAAITTQTASGLTVPAQAVMYPANSGATVFLVSHDSIAHAQPVQIGEIINSERVEIKNGLQVGDQVVVSGAGYLKDGDPVNVATP